MFKFTFNIGSHLFNPFTAQAQAQVQVQVQSQVGSGERDAFGHNATTTSYADAGQSQNGTRKLPAPPPRCGLTVTVPEAEYDNSVGPTVTPLSRKRGWAPSSSSPSEPMSLTTSTNGWLDTPSRYVKAAAAAGGGGSHKGTECDQDFPPAKRRKTITDSILSTALSAALIGTAVGMSAYRMWRDRGTPKQANDSPSVEEIIMDSPPPPYAQEDWVHAVVPRGKATPVGSVTPQYHHHTASSPPASSLPSIPRTPKSARASKARKTARMARHRSSHALASPRGSMPSPSKTAFTAYLNKPDQHPEDDAEEEIDSHMDSMGDKIRKLIEEGQKALGKEVVIMNDDDRDNEEGAVDDGLDGWEEVDESAPINHFTLRIPGERRKKRRPSNANGNVSIAAPSTSLPSRFNEHTSMFHADRPVSPTKQKRPRALTGTSRLGSPVVEPPSVQVIYEPLDLSTSSITPDTSFNYEDEDSLNLSQRMEKIRQAYRLQ